jgi:hypothetical protein
MGSISSKTTGSCSGLISEHSNGGLHRLLKNRHCRGKVSGCRATDGRAGSRLAMSKKAWTVGSKYVLHEVPSRFLAFVPSPFFSPSPFDLLPLFFSPTSRQISFCFSFVVTALRALHNASLESFDRSRCCVGQLPILALLPVLWELPRDRLFYFFLFLSLSLSLSLSLCIVDWIVLRREQHQVPPPRILANLQFQYQLACNLLG